MSTDFYEFSGSSSTNSQVEDKSDIDLDQDIPLCDICQNVILKPYGRNNKLICTECGNIYDPHYELIQIQDKETTLDELSSEGVLSTKSDDVKLRTTINREKGNKHESLKYVNKDFERYRQVEIIDKDTISTKVRRRNDSNTS